MPVDGPECSSPDQVDVEELLRQDGEKTRIAASEPGWLYRRFSEAVGQLEPEAEPTTEDFCQIARDK